MPVFDNRLDCQIKFQHRFFQAVLGCLTGRCKTALEAARRNKGGLPDDMPLSRTQISGLLSWHKRFERDLAIGVDEATIPQKRWLEAVPALIEAVVKWDETLLGKDRLRRLFESEVESALSPAVRAVGNPRWVPTLFDQDTGVRRWDNVGLRAEWHTCSRLCLDQGKALAGLALHACAISLDTVSSGLPQNLSASKFRAARAKGEYAAVYGAVTSDLVSIVNDGRVLPTTAESSCLFGLSLFKDYSGKGIAEAQYLRCSMQALLNYVGQQDETKPGQVWRAAQPLLEHITSDWLWFLAPLGITETGQTEWVVYFPVTVAPTTAITTGVVPVKVAINLPTEVQSIFTKHSWMQWPKGPYLEVRTRASTPELARSQAAELASQFWGCLFLYDRFWRLRHEFNERVALVCPADLSTVTPFSPNSPLPVTQITDEGLQGNWSWFQSLKNDHRPWSRQLARGVHFLRLGEETDEQETRFIHLWRALEAALGHLTGMQAIGGGKDAYRYDIIALVRLLPKEGQAMPIVSEDELRAEVDDVRTEMQPILDIRNLWAFHPADERPTAISHVAHSALEDANQWLKANAGLLLHVLMRIAVNQPEVESRFDAANELRQTLGLEPMIEEADIPPRQHGIGVALVSWFIREVKFRLRKLGYELPD